MLKLLDRIVPGIFFLALLALWQIACTLFHIPAFLLPSPLAVLERIAQIPDRMLVHFLATLREVLLGFAVATAGGVVLAIATAHSRLLTRTLYPLLVVSQTMPIVAIAPVLVIWFGPGDIARLTVVFLIAFFPIFVNMTAGLLRVDEELLDLVRGLNASRWKVLTKIRLPNALPHLFTGMRVSIALSVIGAVVSEFVAAEQGLGYLVFTGATNIDTSLVFAAVFLLAVMGVVLFQFVRLAQSLVVPWARDTNEGEA
jgi:NitT/TauT family transport system permease protein